MKQVVRSVLACALSTASLLTAVSAQKATFANGASSTGWIDFEFFEGKSIFVPAKINGHDTNVLLVTGLPVSDIDSSFAASIGLEAKGRVEPGGGGKDNPAKSVSGLQIQIGNLALPASTVNVVDFAPLAAHRGHPMPMLLGDEVFNSMVVDIDFARRRIAFRDPSNEVEVAGAVVVPLTPEQDQRLVPVSIEGAPPAQFEFGLGNTGEILVYQSYYDSHKLLEGRQTSQRLAAGTGGFLTEDVAMLKRARFAGLEFADMPAAFIPATQTPGLAADIAGDIGLPVLARFRLIIDYPHNRLFAIPYAEVVHAPFAKDRLGLVLNNEGDSFAVRFVARKSPAQMAGFKVGDKISLIEGKSAKDLKQTALANLRFGAAGSRLTFTMKNGETRQVKLDDYF